jgi:hypothetical protein
MNICWCNTINSILSIRTYINTCFICLPTILPSLLSSTLFQTFQSLYIMISSCTYQALTQLAGFTLLGPIMGSPISFPVAPFYSTQHIFGSCPSSNLKAFERQQLYKMCQYMWSIIIYLIVYSPIYSSSNSSYFNVHLNLNIRIYGSVRHQFLFMKTISTSQCLTSV